MSEQRGIEARIEMTVKDIVEEWLKKNGFEGLHVPLKLSPTSIHKEPRFPCTCHFDNLMHCSKPGLSDCKPGYGYTVGNHS